MKLTELATKTQRLSTLVEKRSAINSYLALPCWKEPVGGMSVDRIYLGAGVVSYGGEVFRELLCKKITKQLVSLKEEILVELENEIADLCQELGVENETH